MSRLELGFILGILLLLGGAAAFVVSDRLFAEEQSLDESGDVLETIEGESSAPRRVVGVAPEKSRDEADEEVAVTKEPVELPPLENRISGTVVDVNGPVAGVTVTSKLYFPSGEPNYGLVKKHETEATTLEDGTFALEVPGHGAYRVTLREEAHAPLVRELVRAGEDLDIELDLGATIHGVVRSKATRKPITGVKLTVRTEDGRWNDDFEVAEDGAFTLAGMPTKPILLAATREDFVRYSERLELSAGAAEELTIDLDPGREIRGVVVDKDDTWVIGATVKVGETETVTDDTGRFRLLGLGQQQHYVAAEADGFMRGGMSVNLAGSRMEADIEIVMTPGGRVTGTVIDETGEAVVGAAIKVFQSWGRRSRSLYDTGNSRLQTRTDEDGAFELTGLSASRWQWYTVRVLKQGFAESYSESFKLKDVKEVKNISIVMRSGSLIAGVVVDEQRRPIPGAKVTLSPARVNEWNRSDEDGETTTREILTDDEGRFSFTRLGKGEFRVSALARGYASRRSDTIKIEAQEPHEGIELVMARGGQIVGRITTTDGEAIEGARIWLWSKSSWASGRSGADGEYIVHDVLEGAFTASIRAQGFRRKTERNAVPVEGRLDFQLDPNGSVSGVVSDAETGEKLSGCSVELIREGRNGRRARTMGRARTKGDGSFSVHAADDTYILRVMKNRYINWERKEVRIAAGSENEPIDVQLRPGGAIEGWVRDHLGNPLAGVEVYVKSLAGSGDAMFRRTGRTEKDGYFFADSLATGSYVVAATRRNQTAIHQQRNVSVFAGEVSETRFSFLPPTQLQVVVKDSKGRPVRYPTVTVRSVGEDPISLVSVRDDRGSRSYRLSHEKRYRASRGTALIRDLPRGSFEIDVKRKKYATVTEFVTLEEGQEGFLEIVLKNAKKKTPERP